MPHPAGAGPRPRALALLALVCLLAPGCANVKFSRDTTTSGRFRSAGLAFTLFGIDMPKPAIDIARENVSDVRQPNTRVESVTIFPYFGPLDWILDIISVRYARVTGTWGYASPEEE
jgi:hypothetical protein